MSLSQRHRHRRDRLARIEHLLHTLIRKVDQMAVDQAEFDAALTGFLSEIDDAVQAILAKVPAEVDLSAELAAVNDAKARLDAALTPPAPPVSPTE